MGRLVLCCLALLATPLRAQDLTGTDDLIRAITEAGCLVSDAN